jgi:heme A synthase
LSEALALDLSATSHVFIRLRVLHPALAIGVGVIIAATVHRLPIDASDHYGRRLARSVPLLVALQLALGVLNVVLLAPVWLQMVHLLLADALWIAFVLAGASALAARPVGSAARAPAFSSA